MIYRIRELYICIRVSESPKNSMWNVSPALLREFQKKKRKRKFPCEVLDRQGSAVGHGAKYWVIVCITEAFTQARVSTKRRLSHVPLIIAHF